MFNANSAAILNTKTRLNPEKPEACEYHSSDDFDYVLSNGGKKPIIASSCGPLHGNWEVGTLKPFHADQSGRTMGQYRIIGTINWATGERVGEIPTKACRYYVFK